MGKNKVFYMLFKKSIYVLIGYNIKWVFVMGKIIYYYCNNGVIKRWVKFLENGSVFIYMYLLNIIVIFGEIFFVWFDKWNNSEIRFVFCG